MVPSRIGCDPAVDSAALTFAKAKDYIAGGCRDSNVLKGVLRSYGQTLRLLQKPSADKDLSFLAKAVVRN